MTDQEHLSRFRVVIETVDSEAFTYQVLTWFGSDKAIALAVQEHNREVPTAAVFRVRVEDLGHPEVDDNNVVVVDPADVRDRMEW